MIGYVMVRTNDLDRAAKFYEATFAPLGLAKVERVEPKLRASLLQIFTRLVVK